MNATGENNLENDPPWVAIQRNPRSGAGLQSKPLRELIAEFRKLKIRPRLYSKREELDEAVNHPTRRKSLHGIVAAGGDGTLLDVMNRHPGIPVAILPLGTENLCAKYLGMPRDGKVVARVVADGRTVRFDVGRLASQRFMVMASVGFDASVIHSVHAVRKGHISRWTYLKPIAECLSTYDYPEIRVFIDDSPTPTIGRMVVIANLPSYALGLKVASNARADDGVLDVRVMQRGSILHMFRYLGLIYYRWHERAKDVVQLRGKRIRIESDEPIPIQIDGDPAGYTPTEINVETNVGELFVPRDHKI
ncbi:diacylglycerol/lipid kinase family protein [Thalassoglobus polymorphus]|uniref:Diacylglycerol kinase n=1 Tax=Thalassoglobus polymorphus TaxID=2527994 RepID=A0A517QM86_9PLAN|nr:diacylglycerol kinase family protein [Thalassoglobus polymorphus]QDT32667.1 Diacylglycerol kinase [Thalassoglobus polymorphus]